MTRGAIYNCTEDWSDQSFINLKECAFQLFGDIDVWQAACYLQV